MFRRVRKQTGKETGYRHKHTLGQNFIQDEQLLQQLAELSGVTQKDTVVEIGPGFGSMTRYLSQNASQVLAIEYDEDLKPFLEARLAGCGNVTILYQDVLKTNLAEEVRKRFGKPECLRVAANIPYYITSELIEQVTSQLPEAESIALMVQKEVAEKIIAVPGKEGYGLLSLEIQWRYVPEILMNVPREHFEPQPKVDSSFMLLTKRQSQPFPVQNEKHLQKLIRAAFSAKRKTLANNLSSVLHVDKEDCCGCLRTMGLKESQRAEEMGLAEFCRLSDLLRACDGGDEDAK